MGRKKKSVQPFTIHPDNEDLQSSLNIFSALKVEAPSSTISITKKTGISNSVVESYIESCLEKDLLRVSGSDKEKIIDFNDDDNKKLLGVGFSDERCILSAIDLSGNIIAREEINIRPISEMKGRVNEIKSVADAIRNGTKLAGTKFCCAGIALPDRMVEINPKTLEILPESISHIFNCDVLSTREATAAAYGQRDFGDETRGQDVLYMHSDVGAGIVIKDEMIFEAEDKDAKKNEKYLRPWNQFDMVEAAKALVRKGVGTNIVKLVGGDVDAITSGVILDAAENHDEVAEDLVKRSGLALGVRAAYLVNMFNAEVVILGGGIEKKEGDFLSFVDESAKKFLLKKMANKVKVVPGALGEEANSFGAASLCRRELFMEA